MPVLSPMTIESDGENPSNANTEDNLDAKVRCKCFNRNMKPPSRAHRDNASPLTSNGLVPMELHRPSGIFTTNCGERMRVHVRMFQTRRPE